MLEDQIGVTLQDDAGGIVVHGTPVARNVVVVADAHLRAGGATRGKDNIIQTIQAGEYSALYQCAGEEVVESGHANFWWVRIVSGPHGSGPQGWVSATLIKGGGDGPIPDVPPRPTTFV